MDDTITFSSDYQLVGIFKDIPSGSIEDITFDNIYIIAIVPGPEYYQTTRAGIIAGSSTNLTLTSVEVTNCKMHIASNMFLRYVGGLVGSSENLFAINVNSSNVSLVIKNAEERDVVGYGIGGLVGRANKLTSIASDLFLHIGSTA